MLTLLFPACGCQVGQFPVFLRQLEFAVAKAGSPGEALLGQAPIGRQQGLPVHLEFLKLKEITQSQEMSTPSEETVPLSYIRRRLHKQLKECERCQALPFCQTFKKRNIWG